MALNETQNINAHITGYVVKNALLGFKNKVLFSGLVDRGFDQEFAESGANKGDEIFVKKPAQYRVRVGAKMKLQNIKERKIKVKIGEQTGVDFQFNVREATFEIDHGKTEYAKNYIRPAGHTLASFKDAEGMKKASLGAGYTIISAGSDTNDELYGKFTKAKAFLKKMLSEDDQSTRYSLVGSDIEDRLSEKIGKWYNAAAEVTKAIKTAGVSNVGIGGLTWGSSDQAYVHTNGAGGKHVTGAITVVPDYENETQVITLNAAVAGLAVGDTIEFDGVTGTGTAQFTGSYFVNPETKAKYAQKLQRKVLAIDSTDKTKITVYPILPAKIVDGTSGVTVTTENVDDESTVTATVLTNLGVTREELRARLAMANCDVLPAGGGTVLGTAGKNYLCCPVFQKKAVKMTGIKLVTPKKSVEMSDFIESEGFALRYIEDYNIENDTMPDRIDMLAEYTIMYPEWLVDVEVQID